jgi:hypothetical protein
MKCAAPDCFEPRSGKSRYCKKHRQSNRNKPKELTDWYKSQVKDEPVMCFCKCGRQALPGKIYASQACCNRVYKRRLREEGKSLYTKKPQFVRTQPVHGAMVYDPQCSPYSMPKADALKYLAKGEFLPGTVVKIGDKAYQVEAEQTELL